jgi:aminomethyltransferase
MRQHEIKEEMSDAYLNLQSKIRPRYRVEGQQALMIHLAEGDLLYLSSEDHQQVAEVLVFDCTGMIAPHLLTDQKPSPAFGTLQQLSAANSSAAKLKKQLCSYQVTDDHLQTCVCFNTLETVVLKARQKVRVVVIAPGLDMTVFDHAPTTEIHLSVIPFVPVDEFLPRPLDQVDREFRISRATASSYIVKEGEWIQIIDVAGKQCSDFLAFDYEALLKGDEKGLDAVATRTVQGISTPTPGLHARFLDQDMTTMIEVIQDTVGRHDSFLMACSPKYYEDSGYFGHISCSDNFNGVLAKEGIRPRAAWPAINFFFNTDIAPCGSVVMDEPWSRPGDYVLLRANRDLLCASSACPDDIDPANGWSPTDIHVRIYTSQCQFPRAIASRVTPEEPPRMTKHTAFHTSITKLTSQLVEYRGYWVANEYQGWGAKAEYLACRERVAMIDLSPLRKFEITGPDAEAFLQFVLTRNVSRLSVGEIVYSAICQDTGGMIDDGTLFRMGEHAFRWVCGDPYTGHWMREQAAKKDYRVSIRNSTDQLHNVAVQGPESRRLLTKLIWSAESEPRLDNLAWFHFLIGRIGGPTGIPVMVSRTGYTGELGFEVWCHPDHGETVWQAIWEAGQTHDIAPMGFAALDMLRIEAGLIFAEHEFSPEVNPFEAGIGFTVPLKTKETDFIGRDAMLRQAPESRHKLMGLLLEGGDPVTHGDLVYHDRFPVGVITSAAPSPRLGKQIALCRLAPEYAEEGLKLSVGKLDGHQKRLTAVVTNLPFYDPERTRVRS